MPRTRKRPVTRRHTTKLGRLLARARARKEQTKAQASRTLQVAPTTVANWELAGKRPLRSHLPRLAAYLDLTIDAVSRLRGAK